MTPLGKYKGFITHKRFRELRELLVNITELSGTENKLHHLYSPDTDMNDNICENLQDSKINIVMDLNKMKERIDNLIKRILELK